MSYNEILERFEKQLKKEALIKSICNSVILILSTMAFLMLCLILTNKDFYIEVLVLSVLLFLISVICFYIKYKPNEYTLARRIDLLGLKERIITMNELKDSNSFIALKQREDALLYLDTPPPGFSIVTLRGC